VFLQHALDASVFQHAPQPLQHAGMGTVMEQAVLSYLFQKTRRDLPAELASSLASIVSSLSRLAALNRASTTVRNSSLSKVPSLSASAAAKSLALSLPLSSRGLALRREA
jgi:hypothetical protein